MKCCRNCGKEIVDNERVCPYCKASQNEESMDQLDNLDENEGCLLSFIGSSFPIISILLFNDITKSDSKRSKALLEGIVLSIILFVVIIIMGLILSK